VASLHSDKARIAIQDCNIFIIQAAGGSKNEKLNKCIEYEQPLFSMTA
jgi:hypothetical protein